MKIIKYKKEANNLYKVYLDNDTILKIYEETILKYNLLLKKDLDDITIQNVLEENKKWDCYYSALKILKRVAKSKYEIHKYLKDKDYPDDLITNTINLLEQQSYLNDKRYAESYVNMQILTTNKGPKKIEEELLKKKIAKIDYEDALSMYKSDIEEEKIKKIITKKIKANHTKSVNSLKQKIRTSLIIEGFNQSLVTSLLNSTSIKEDETLKEKEYQKYYKKLSRKYQGKELEYKLKQKMYSLGFNITNDD